MKTFRKALLALSAVAALALTAGAVQASPVNYSFSGVIDTSVGTPSLVGETFSGTFSYEGDDYLGPVTDVLALLSLEFDFLGHHYTLAAADDNSTFVDFDINGTVLGIEAYFSGVSQTTLSAGFGDPFLGFISEGGVDSSGSYTVTAVPEPAMLALSLVGLGAAGFATSRRRRQPGAAA